MKCPYCNGEAELRDSSVIYGKSYGNAFICENYPDCDSYVGVHEKNNKPLGTLADKELRQLRKKAHALFDRLWKEKITTRKNAYIYLDRIMGMKKGEAHIGGFNKEQCKFLIKKLEVKE